MKLIVVTGGVLSGLGKGVAAASIGHLLANDYHITPIKCDGYLNVDPGTMNPVEHGEVFVLDDGTEVDMDFGHYERFMGVTCTKEHSITMGRVYNEVRKKERRGDYLGKTVQLIPHVTDAIKENILSAGKGADIILVEIGGTVGDLENELFIEACRQLSRDIGRKNVLFAHLAYVPKPGCVGEHKTKPTQQSVQLLLQRGITPDMIITRSEEPVSDALKEKIRLFTGAQLIVSGHDLADVYDIPKNFYEQGVLEFLNDQLSLSATYSNNWEELLQKSRKATQTVRIGIAGKYTALEDSYASVVEALKHAAAHQGVRMEVEWVETTNGSAKDLKNIDGVIVPGGFGSRGIEGKIDIIRYCRENDVPYLGICYGMQLAVVEYARNVCGLAGAHTTEVDADTGHPVVDILPEQLAVVDKGGTMRLGAWTATLTKGVVQELYGSKDVSERDRHRYEINPAYHERLTEKDLVICGEHEGLAEFIELPEHPFFVATQAHPELKSTLECPAPLFLGLVRAASKR